MDLGNDIEHIIAGLDGGVLTLRINRPEKKNALIAPMYARMAELVRRAGDSEDVRAIYITGTPDCFSSGNDVSTFTGMERGEDGDTPPVRLLRALAHCELPLVAAVNGPAIGVGTTMLLHCDFVIAGEEARFQTPFVNLGVCPEAGSSLILPRLMGYARAAELLLLCEILDAGQAREYGLVNAVHPAQDYQREALELAKRLSTLPPTSMRATKKLMRAPVTDVIDAVMEAENTAFADCMQSPEFSEAITAFMERRAPDFSGC